MKKSICPQMVTAEEGRETVEIITAIYRGNKPIKFPLTPENSHHDFDGGIL